MAVADHVWADKQAEIAKKVDDLGNQFRPAMRAGWLAYTTKTYIKEAFRTGPALGQDALVVADDDASFGSAPGCRRPVLRNEFSSKSLFLVSK